MQHPTLSSSSGCMGCVSMDWWAAAAVIDLGRRGVGGGTVATTISHLSTTYRG